jgi:lipopolysaccharide export system permease protein
VKSLSRYVFKTVFVTILLVLMVILSVDVIAEIIDEVGEMKVDYSFSDVLLYVGTTMPRRIYENIPFSALIGCLIGLGMLASNSELVVMRAAGVSLLRVVTFVLYPVMCFILMALLLGEFAVPYTDQLAEGRRAIQMGRQDNMNNTGLWNKEGNELINVGVVFPDGSLYGVSRYQFDGNNRLTETSFAERAHYREGSWRESGGRITRFEDQRTLTETFDSREWHTSMTPDLMRLVAMDANSLPLSDLYDYGNYLNEQGQNSGRHWLAFWRKALQPLTILSLVLIAVSFVFGPLRESTTGLRVFAGVVTGIVFSTSQDMLGPASLVYGFAPFWAVLVPIVVSVVFGLLLLRRAA